MHQSDEQSGRPRNRTNRARIGKASGSADRSFGPDAVRYAEVTASSVIVSGFDLVFCRAGGVAFWLLQCERDRDADQVEGLTVGAGGLGEHRDAGAGAGEPDLVAGQGGQVLEQALEAAVGAAGRVVLG
jgi:hypothetical protein